MSNENPKSNSQRRSPGTLPRMRHALAAALAALTTGSRTIPLGDNGELLRALATRVGNAETRGSHAARDAGALR